jgi:hypothetical protein
LEARTHYHYRHWHCMVLQSQWVSRYGADRCIHMYICTNKTGLQALEPGSFVFRTRHSLPR